VHGEIWNVELSYIYVAGGSWQILINKMYHGTLFKRDGEWRFNIGRKSELTTTDLQLLSEIIEEHIDLVRHH
jgi:hypothetical protein